MARQHAASPPRPSWCAAAVLVVAAVVLPAQQAHAETVHVAARGTAFVPAVTSVQQTAGEPASPAAHGHVVWTNEDAAEHTVTFDDPRLVSSGRLATGQTYEAVISLTGSFAYRCTIHPGMTGTVVVTPAPPPTAEGATAGPSAGGDGGSNGSPAVVVALAAAAVAALAALAWFLVRRRRAATAGAAAR